jgi:hypothetical protein
MTDFEAIEIRKRLFGLRREEYINGKKLSGDFLADVQYLTKNYDLRTLKRYLKLAAGRYENGEKEYRDLVGKLFTASLLKMGGIVSKYENQRRFLNIRRGAIEALAKELYSDENLIKMTLAWEKSIRNWIINLYVVGDFLPGYGWSSFTALIDELTLNYQKKKEELSRLLEESKNVAKNIEDFISSLISENTIKQYKSKIGEKAKESPQLLEEIIAREIIENRDKFAENIAALKYKIEEICEETGENPEKYTELLEKTLDRLYGRDFQESASKLVKSCGGSRK